MKLINKKITLNNGVEMPQVGYGTYKIQDDHQGVQAIKHAINHGYLMIDTAEYYDNQKLIAKAIALSDKTREDLFITSKIWNNHQSYRQTIKAFNQILNDLDTDYLDLCLVHWPATKGIECYQALEELYAQGKIRAIGVSNFEIEDLQELLKVAKVVPAVNQVELHPLLPQIELQKFCKDHSIAVESWRTIYRGKADNIPYIGLLADKYHVDAAAICLKWAIQRDIIVIPKSVTPSRIDSNADLLDIFELTTEEITMINKLGPIDRTGPDPKTWGKKWKLTNKLSWKNIFHKH